MLRRLCPIQPESFAFTSANQAWAEGQISKFPEGRQASAIIPILWRAQEQEGWLTRAAIEHVAGMLDLAYIRALEVATFYFMFQLQPVGSIANIQICGTTSCMICGAEDLIAVCREMIAPKAHQVSADGKFSWEEVECLGACTNAPMVQIGKDYYEDLTPDSLRDLIRRFSDGEVPKPGPQNGRFASEPKSGLTSLKDFTGQDHNASVQAALDIGETVKRIDGTEVPLLTPWRKTHETPPDDAAETGALNQPRPAKDIPVDETGITEQEPQAVKVARPAGGEPARAAEGDGTDTPAASVPETAKAPDSVPIRVEPSEDATPAPVAVRPTDGSHAATPKDGPVGPDRTGPQVEVDGPVDAVAVTRESKVVDSAPENQTADQPILDSAVVIEGRPLGLAAARTVGADDLTRIDGLGPALVQAVNGLGIWHFDQIALWTVAEAAWVDLALAHMDAHVVRDDWVGQARALAPMDEGR